MTKMQEIKKEYAEEIRQLQIEKIMPMIHSRQLLGDENLPFVQKDSNTQYKILSILQEIVQSQLEDEFVEQYCLGEEDSFYLFTISALNHDNVPAELLLTLEHFEDDKDDPQHSGGWQRQPLFDEVAPLSGWLAIENPEGPFITALQYFGCDSIDEFVDLIGEAVRRVYHAEGPEIIGLNIQSNGKWGQPYLITAVFYDEYGYDRDCFVGICPIDGEQTGFAYRYDWMEDIVTNHYDSYCSLLRGFFQWRDKHRNTLTVTCGRYHSSESQIFVDAHNFGIDKDGLSVDCGKIANVYTIPEAEEEGVHQYNATHGIFIDPRVYVGGTNDPIYDVVNAAEAFHFWTTSRR